MTLLTRKQYIAQLRPHALALLNSTEVSAVDLDFELETALADLQVKLESLLKETEETC